MNFTNRRPIKRGVSLVELTFVSLIIGILAASAGPRYLNAHARFRIQGAAKRVAADLNHARNESLNLGADITVTFDTVSNQYLLPEVKDPLGYSASYLVDLSNLEYPARLVSADFSGGLSVTFNRYGMPSSGGLVTIFSDDLTGLIILDAITGIASVEGIYE